MKYGDAFIVSSHRSNKKPTIYFDSIENLGAVAKQSFSKGVFVFNEVIDGRNERVIAVTESIKESVFGISVRMNYSEAFSDLLYFKKEMIVIITISVILIIIFSLFLSNSISKPIIQLSRLTEDISNGNYDKKISIRSNNEIGVLAKSFNKMVKNLQLDINRREIIEKELIKSKNELQLNYSSLKVVQNISNAVQQPNDLLKLAEASVNAMMKYTGLPTVVLFTYGKNDDHIKYLYSKDLAEEVLNTIKQLPLDESLSGITAKTKKIQISEDIYSDNLINIKAKTTLINSNYKSTISIPIIYQDEVLGVINLIFKEKQTFNNTEKETFLAIGKTIGIAFSNVNYLNHLKLKIEEHKLGEEKIKELIEIEKNRTIELEESYEQLLETQNASLNMLNDLNVEITQRKRSEQIQKVLYNISNAVTITDNLEALVKQIQEDLGTIIDTTNFYIALYDNKKDMLSLPFYADEKDKFASIPAGKSLTKYVVETKKSLLANIDIKKKLAKEGKLEYKGSLSKIWLGVPLKIEGEITGVLAVQSYTNENAYNESDKKLLEFISHQISVSIDRKQAEQNLTKALEKATESDRLKTAFLANMSHEIRTPMNSILGFSNLLKEPELTSDEKQQYIKTIEKSGKRLLNLISDIVNISKIESEQIVTTNTKTNIVELVDYIYNNFKPEAEQKGLDIFIKNSLLNEKIIINTDREKLSSILSYLVKNAIKYTKEGFIEFGYNLNEDNEHTELEFYVKDTGIGISKDRQKAIFHRFVQADIEDKEVYEGAGLGLSISKAYVEMLGGNIWVESVEGKGSQFYFTIPYNLTK